MQPRPVAVLVGGVSQLFQGDLDLGRLAVEQLAAEDLGHGVLVEDLHYGAVAVAQRLQEVQPAALVLVGAEQRGRSPGAVTRRHATASAANLQAAVADAVQGYVSIDLVVDVAAGLDALPERVVAVEVEPASTATSEELSAPARRGLVGALAVVRQEVQRSPVLLLATEIRAALADHALAPSPALRVTEQLLDELARLDRDGRWGRTFGLRDQLRSAIAAGMTGEGMTHLDWGLWWTLIEALDRLQRAEATA